MSVSRASVPNEGMLDGALNYCPDGWRSNGRGFAVCVRYGQCVPVQTQR